ncbi:MAG: 30S ribosomal protein S20 [Candidatus Harrisonbacteria bacterium]|nr:30S ribosomal protein S20 [Candidatus Harrisonbacteria bacterium]
MPNTRTAKKNIRKNKTRREHNDSQRKVLKDLIREVRKSTASSKKDEALKNLPIVYKKLDKAAKTNLIKKNKAARLKSRLTKAISKIK